MIQHFSGICHTYVDAAADLEKATVYSQDGLIFEHLGDAYAATYKTEKALGAWAKALAAQDRRLLIVIDDIDRLAQDEVAELFAVVKGLADFPNTIYVDKAFFEG